ncbi:MAG: succinate dehydrogenase assembly factor 2 [Gammaproteobacteria bacterium]|nr:succinate dehydrogenase assembly factor 2 [Gammaproteobacteria bacterium]
MNSFILEKFIREYILEGTEKTSVKNDRLYWSCKRGMLELDLILIPFGRYKHPNLTPALQRQYSALLECTDRELYQWLIKHETPEDEMQAIVALVRDYAIDPSRPRTL